VRLSDVQDGYWLTPDGTWMRWVPAPDVTSCSIDGVRVTVARTVDTGTTTGVERGVWRALDDCVMERPA
jgi:hypothetical protein